VHAMSLETPPKPSAPSKTPVLEVEGINKTFGAVTALTDVDLDVFAGEVVALVGDNGAGKSTLIKAISGVGPPDSGSFRIAGEEVTISRPADAQRLGIATVFQDLALCDNLDLVANLFLGRETSTFSWMNQISMEQKSRELLDELAVTTIQDIRAPVGLMSGGQRQSVAIARSLLGEPRVVILDEPTAALGVAQTAEVLSLVENLRSRGFGVILISHNLADIFEVADRVAVLRLGKNAGVHKVSDVTREQVVASITGADDNSVTRRQTRSEEMKALREAEKEAGE
jgi:D-xylose transport system ATP-binding protein